MRADTDRLPHGAEKARRVRAMFDTIAPDYDRINGLMTFGLDKGWRRRTVAALGLSSGAVVVDLERAGLVASGFDLSAGMLGAAHTVAPLTRADVTRLPLADASVDGATCGFALRNLVDLVEFQAELARVVRPGGRIALLEVAEPPNPVMRLGHRLYFTQVVPRLGALLSDRAAYRFLPLSVAYLPSTESLLAGLTAAGFVDVCRHLFTGGVVQLLVGTRA